VASISKNRLELLGDFLIIDAEEVFLSGPVLSYHYDDILLVPFAYNRQKIPWMRRDVVAFFSGKLGVITFDNIFSKREKGKSSYLVILGSRPSSFSYHMAKSYLVKNDIVVLDRAPNAADL
jgi:hypothetical protein